MRSGVSDDVKGKITPESERDAARAKYGLAKIDREAQAVARANARTEAEKRFEKEVGGKITKLYAEMDNLTRDIHKYSAHASNSTTYNPAYRKEAEAKAKELSRKMAQAIIEKDKLSMSLMRTEADLKMYAQNMGLSLQKSRGEISKRYPYVLRGKKGSGGHYFKDLKGVLRGMRKQQYDDEISKVRSEIDAMKAKEPKTRKWTGTTSLEWYLGAINQAAAAL